MNFIEGVAVSNLCDYSFGDQAGCLGRVPGAFMKQADLVNQEFISICNQNIAKGKNLMTLFIDNIRLYKRQIKASNERDQKWIDALHETNDLLELCGKIEKINFIIFTNLEDTPIDETIHKIIPDNVISIHAVNAISFGKKVIPFPYGLQRILNNSDNRIPIISNLIEKEVTPKKLVYINHTKDTNLSERGDIKKILGKHNYVTVDDRIPFEQYCKQIQNHKFMICPQGNGVDCHRNWEVLYLKRVPIMKKTEYLMELYKEYPVLWVDDYSKITKTLLINNDHLYVRAKNIENNLLDLYSLFNRIVRDGKDKIK